MTGQRDPVRHLIEDQPDLAQQVTHVVLDRGAAGVEHRSVLLVDDLDPQPFRGQVQPHLLLQIGQLRIHQDGVLDPSRQGHQVLALTFLQFGLQ